MGNDDVQKLEPSVHNVLELPNIKKKSSPELHGVYYKMQGYSQTRKYKKKNNSPKVNVVEIMKSGRRILLKPKKERVEDLQFKYTSSQMRVWIITRIVKNLRKPVE